jgi:hypothetical protein
MNKEGIYDELREFIKALTSQPISETVRKDKEFTFPKLEYPLEFIKNKLIYLNSHIDILDELPENQSESILQALSSFRKDVLIPLYNFNPENPENPTFRRTQIFEKFDKRYERLYSILLTFVERKELQEKAESGTSEEELNKELENAKRQAIEIEKLKIKALEDLKSLESAASATRDVSSKKGVSKFSEIFAFQAKENLDASRIWLGISVIFSACMGWFLWDLFNKIQTAIEKGTAKDITIQLFLAKILIFSFLSALLYQVIKNYNVNKHLFTLNTHRHNVLTIFKTFYEGSEESKVKDAILLEATRTIFEAGNSGYISEKDGNPKVTELINIFGKGNN